MIDRSPRTPELHRSPRICEKESAKKKWRRRPAAAAPPRRLQQVEQVGLLTELGEFGARLARALGATKVVNAERIGAAWVHHAGQHRLETQTAFDKPSSRCSATWCRCRVVGARTSRIAVAKT
ncbi:MAG: hypothetical protein ACLQJ0_26150 [Steroidobacteraceae bacterium]|jgi:hypothetical protein